nr:unnamed protein product [Callosobruchus analis]
MDLITTIAITGGFICLDQRKRRKSRRVWTYNWLQKRNKFSHMAFLRELAANEPQDVKNYMRMSKTSFQELLQLVSSRIGKQNTIMRASVSAEERLAATLQFLASGRSYKNLKYSCAISPQLLGGIIPET